MSQGSGKRLLCCSWHSYFDPSSGAAHSLRDLLELLTARGWSCRAVCAAHLDYEKPPPLAELLAAHGLAFQVTNWAKPGLPPFATIDFDQRGVPVTLYAPATVPRHDAVTPADAVPLLALYEQALDQHRPEPGVDLWRTRSGSRDHRPRRRRGCPVVFWLRNFAYFKADLFRNVSGILAGSALQPGGLSATVGDRVHGHPIAPGLEQILLPGRR